MAKDNDNDKGKKSEIKNPELLNPDKDTQDQRLARGPIGIPKEGQSWVEAKASEKKSEIKKPNLYYEAMKTKEADKEKDKTKQVDKDINHDKE